MIETDVLVLPTDPWNDHTITDEDLVEIKECPICYIDFEKGDNVAKLNCGHIYHKNCIILWFDKNLSSPTCPICRINMFDNKSNQDQTNVIHINNDDFQSELNIFGTQDKNSTKNEKSKKSSRKQSNSSCCILI